ncbi:toprim domain-containing protein [Methylocystis rosea]|uniref:Toprim domain-containing protein n=1 Tax=Methylocystis rosea TaxID=173366 RepID=A0A3G8MAZ7_9HYPH|nr:toprim domain-containing protein [Methylocystis rosea]AZG78986.1 toprim domain-containing protein [Methylocystis rosea]
MSSDPCCAVSLAHKADLAAQHRVPAQNSKGGPRRRDTLIVAADNDRAGQNAAHKLADDAKADGVKVQTFVSTEKDFNDDLRRVTREHLLRQLVNHLQ